MDEATAKRIVDAVLRNLDDRAGFDEWWESIDCETRRTLEIELRDVVQDAAS